MKSLMELYKIGPGPSSSHTFGPMSACLKFKQAYPQATRFQVILYGSLSLTGKGHLTDQICIQTMAPLDCEVIFSHETCDIHPNTLDLLAYQEDQLLDTWRVYSIGGGAIQLAGSQVEETMDVYPQLDFKEIQEYCHSKKISLVQYVDQYEQIDTYLSEILNQMLQTVQNGLVAEGVLPGRLKLARVAKRLYQQALEETNPINQQKLYIMAYAYAASEENAAGGLTVTAPTMGASGVIPAILSYYVHQQHIPLDKCIQALKVAGMIGNLFKTNATISGAKGGCQAEIGVACSMGAALVCVLEDYSDAIIAYAAEVGIEHFLGLTCDPVGGYVMIPCIERNSVAALRALDSAFLAQRVGSLKLNKVSLDMVIKTMNYTGQKIAVELKETSLGGLASEVPLN